MYKEILITLDDREGRAAVLEDGVVTEHLIAREERQVGSIYKGRVANVLPGMNAAFVDVGLERNAFLCADDAAAHLGDEASQSLGQDPSIKDLLKVNQEMLVQVVKEAVGTKGARITTYITIPGRYLVLLPSARYIGVSRRIEEERERARLRSLAEGLRPDGMGLIIRTAAAGRDAEQLERELDYLVRVWEKVRRTAEKRRAPALIHQELPLVDQILRDCFTPDVARLIVDDPGEYREIRERLEIAAPSLVERVHLYTDPRPLFDLYGVEKAIDNALQRKVWLPSGGYLIIDRTEALWVIDVNTGKYIGKTSLAETILQTNLEAVKEICRQLRLRDLSGIIVIDFIDMDAPAHRRKVMTALAEELRRDRTRTHLVGMTELGLVQLTRKREGKDLDAVMREACPACSGRGRILSVQTLSLKIRREISRIAALPDTEAILVETHPRVAFELLTREVEDLESRTGKPIYVRADRDAHPEFYQVRGGSAAGIRGAAATLRPGREARVRLEGPFGANSQNALAVVDGNLVEVSGAGGRVGERLRIRVTETGRNLCRAEIFGQH